MDATDKVKVFHSLDDLKEAISVDVKSRDVLVQRYCVRFIMLNNFDAFRELTKFLVKELGVEKFDLEELALGPDKTVDIDTLSNAVRNLKVSSIVTPFSELARFFKEDEFKGFLNDIILSEDISHPQKRIYIPVIGLHNRFLDFLKSFGRIEESAPIWQYYMPKDDKVIVYVSKFKDYAIPDKLNICSLPTMRDWLRFWKQQAPKDKILCGAAPILNRWPNAKPDSIFTFLPVDNSYEFITKFLEISLPIEYKEDELEYWDNLLQNIGKNATHMFDFSRYVEELFNRKTITTNDILSLWADGGTPAYARWLLKAYALTYKESELSGYMRDILHKIDDFKIANTLFVNLTEQIFNMTNVERLQNLDSRKDIMQSQRDLFRALVPEEHQSWLKKHIIEIAQKDDSLSQVKRLCTATFDFEEALFLSWYVLRAEKDFGFSQLKEFYPDLTGYLTPFEAVATKVPVSWVANYLEQYRRAKMVDNYTDELKSIVDERNASAESFYNWYYSFQNSHDLLSEIQNDHVYPIDKIYWVDGLGAEFIPFIHYLFENSQSGYEAVLSQIARTNIPSNTHLNSFDVDNQFIFKLSALDELAHEGHYQKYTTLVAELKTVKEVIYKILADNKVSKHTIAIVSDHGLSAMSRKCDSLKIDSKTKHEGRYVPLADDSTIISDIDFVVHKNECDHKKYKVALRHQSLGAKPTHEVHGGATPEEVLVPFIVISNDDASKPLKYTVIPVETKVPISAKKVAFKIIPEPKSAKAIFNDQTIALTRYGMLWEGIFPNASEGRHYITVIPFRGKSVQLEIEFFGMGFGSGLDLDDF
ncbi:MAG: BREX-4 system phosphatase PglZ [Prevotella sp.]|nr:BREX-4 system phosphatase PglZ [Prevotella sp.]